MIVAECPPFPAAFRKDERKSEALENIREAKAGSLGARAANGMPLTIAVREVEVPV
jgi:hypothetical protein